MPDWSKLILPLLALDKQRILQTPTGSVISAGISQRVENVNDTSELSKLLGVDASCLETETLSWPMSEKCQSFNAVNKYSNARDSNARDTNAGGDDSVRRVLKVLELPADNTARVVAETPKVFNEDAFLEQLEKSKRSYSKIQIIEQMLSDVRMWSTSFPLSQQIASCLLTEKKIFYSAFTGSYNKLQELLDADDALREFEGQTVKLRELRVPLERVLIRAKIVIMMKYKEPSYTSGFRAFGSEFLNLKSIASIDSRKIILMDQLLYLEQSLMVLGSVKDAALTAEASEIVTVAFIAAGFVFGLSVPKDLEDFKLNEANTELIRSMSLTDDIVKTAELITLEKTQRIEQLLKNFSLTVRPSMIENAYGFAKWATVGYAVSTIIDRVNGLRAIGLLGGNVQPNRLRRNH